MTDLESFLKLSSAPVRDFPLPSARSKEEPYYRQYDDVPVAAGKPKGETNSKHKLIGIEIGTDEINPDITKREGSKLIICPRSFERESIVSKFISSIPGLKKIWNLGIIQVRLNSISLLPVHFRSIGVKHGVETVKAIRRTIELYTMDPFNFDYFILCLVYHHLRNNFWRG